MFLVPVSFTPPRVPELLRVLDVDVSPTWRLEKTAATVAGASSEILLKNLTKY